MDSNYSLFIIVDKGGEDLGIKLQGVSLKVLGVERNFQNFPSLFVRLVSLCFPICLF
jgi:hypothetical protein